MFQTLNAGTQTKINGTLTAKEVITPSVSLSGSYTSYLYSNEPMRTDTIQDYSVSGAYQTTTRTVFHNTSDPVYNGKLYSQVNPDGTKMSASYWKGSIYSWLGGPSWNSTSFVPLSTATTWVSTCLSGTSTQQDPTAVLYSNDGTTGGMAIDPVWMTPFRSYRRQTVTDIYGNPAYDVNEVFTGTGFQIISWHVTGYSWDGLLETDQDSSGSWTECIYTDGHLAVKINPDGTRMIVTAFDALMRVTQSETGSVGAIGSYPAMGSVLTNYTYDGSSNVVEMTKAPAAGGLSLVTNATFNQAGLVTSQTDASNLQTTYAYTNGTRTLTTTYPNGSALITDKYLDGSAKSVSGNAAVNQYNSSVVNSDGSITATNFQGASASGGSPRWTSVQTDWLGRAIAQSEPSFGSTTLFDTKQNFYNSSGQLFETTQTGKAATLYQYDGLGQLQYTALDICGSGLPISTSGTDRITGTSSQVYEDSNGIWWNRTQTFVYNVAGSSTAAPLSDVRQRLVPYASNNADYLNGVKITETDSYDSFGNLTKDVTNSNSSTAILTETKTLPNSSIPSVSVKYNGVLVSSQTPQNITTTYQYDGLYRNTSSVDPRKGTSYTAYFTATTGENGKVASTTDAAGNATNYTYYAADGRLSSQTDPTGNVVYHAYDYAGREIRTWGTGTYPVENAFDSYGSRIAMRTFRPSTANFGTSGWPALLDDGSDPQNPAPSLWSATNGDKTAWTFDGPTGLLISKADASNNAVGYSYYPDGKIETRTWARGIVTTYSYDPATAELTGKSYSDGVTPSLTYTFDRLGHPSTAVETFVGPSTITTAFQYNVPGKLTNETFDTSYFAGRQIVYQLDITNSGTLGRTIGYELGTSSNPIQDQDVSGYGYDANGRLNAVGLTGSATFDYAFAPNSNLIGSITDFADNWSQTRTWDPNRDLIDTIQTSSESVPQGSFGYVYDSLGRRMSKTATGALFSRYPASGIVDAYTYDSLSEVIGDQAYHSTNPSSLTTAVTGRGFTYAYDPIGNRTTSSIDSIQTTSYTSNALNQIITRVVPGYYPVSGFAPAGATVTLNGTAIPSGQFNGQFLSENVTASNLSSPQWITALLVSSLGGSVTANAFVPQTPETCTYDADGNILSDGRWDYTWDGENRLLWITTFGTLPGESQSVWNSGAPRVTIGFTYDYQGRRILKKSFELEWVCLGIGLQEQVHLLEVEPSGRI